MLTWTSEPPTEPGFYFVQEQDYCVTRRVLYVFKKNRTLHIGVSKMSRHFHTKTLHQFVKDYKFMWAGPIPEPKENA